MSLNMNLENQSVLLALTTANKNHHRASLKGCFLHENLSANQVGSFVLVSKLHSTQIKVLLLFL